MFRFLQLKLLRYEESLLQKENDNPFTEFVFRENENYSPVERCRERVIDSLRTTT
jgi:hypothetical protein